VQQLSAAAQKQQPADKSRNNSSSCTPAARPLLPGSNTPSPPLAPLHLTTGCLSGLLGLAVFLGRSTDAGQQGSSSSTWRRRGPEAARETSRGWAALSSPAATGCPGARLAHGRAAQSTSARPPGCTGARPPVRALARGAAAARGEGRRGGGEGRGAARRSGAEAGGELGDPNPNPSSIPC
jgi:hypothetical protein